MAMELYDGALKGIKGKFYEDPVFDCDPKEAEAYNKNFPAKEPAQTVPIEVLLSRLPEAAQKSIRAHEMPCLAWLNRFSGREMLTWEGIDEDVLATINEVLTENGIAKKLPPDSVILENAKKGIRVLEPVL